MSHIPYRGVAALKDIAKLVQVRKHHNLHYISFCVLEEFDARLKNAFYLALVT